MRSHLGLNFCIDTARGREPGGGKRAPILDIESCMVA